MSNQKSSKVALLDRATTHIRYLEMTQQQLQTRLAAAEAETNRLRQCVFGFSIRFSRHILTFHIASMKRLCSALLSNVTLLPPPPSLLPQRRPPLHASRFALRI